jgi:hypothetical protein
MREADTTDEDSGIGTVSQAFARVVPAMFELFQVQVIT